MVKSCAAAQAADATKAAAMKAPAMKPFFMILAPQLRSLLLIRILRGSNGLNQRSVSGNSGRAVRCSAAQKLVLDEDLHADADQDQAAGNLGITAEPFAGGAAGEHAAIGQDRGGRADRGDREQYGDAEGRQSEA